MTFCTVLLEKSFIATVFILKHWNLHNVTKVIWKSWLLNFSFRMLVFFFHLNFGAVQTLKCLSSFSADSSWDIAIQSFSSSMVKSSILKVAQIYTRSKHIHWTKKMFRWLKRESSKFFSTMIAFILVFNIDELLLNEKRIFTSLPCSKALQQMTWNIEKYLLLNF